MQVLRGWATRQWSLLTNKDYRTLHYSILICSPAMVATNIAGDLESDEPIIEGLTARQVLYFGLHILCQCCFDTICKLRLSFQICLFCVQIDLFK